MQILIIDDHPMTCAGLQSLLQSHYPDADVATLHSLDDLDRGMPPCDYIFLDMHLPGFRFRDILTLLADWLPRVILISAYPEQALVDLARRQGVRGLLPKNMDISHLLDGFRRIQAGEPVFLDAQGQQIPGESSGGNYLTERQRDIYEALLGGLSNKQIARKLGISEYTVKEHVAAVLASFGVHSRLELVLQQRSPPA